MVMPPKTIRIGRGRRQTEYVRADDFVCKPSEQLTSDDDLVSSSDELGYAIVRQTNDRAADYPDDSPRRPVYRVGKTDAVAIPTGRLFVRLPKRNTLKNNADILDSLGMRVDAQNAWAPHTGWVVLKSGNVADAISRVDAVAERLDARVEPELLSVRKKRTSTRP